MLRRCLRRLLDPNSKLREKATEVGSAALPPGRPTHASWYREGVIIRRNGCFKSQWRAGGMGNDAHVPLQDRAMIHCVDNTNVKHVSLIKQVSPRFHHHRVLPVVVHRVSMLRFRSGREKLNRHQIEPGAIYYAALFSHRHRARRRSGLVAQFDRTTGIILDDKKVPIGTRVMYVAARHMNHRAHLKAAVMANFFF